MKLRRTESEGTLNRAPDAEHGAKGRKARTDTLETNPAVAQEKVAAPRLLSFEPFGVELGPTNTQKKTVLSLEPNPADAEISTDFSPRNRFPSRIEDGMEQVNYLAPKLLKMRLWPDRKDATKQWASSVVDNGFDPRPRRLVLLFCSGVEPIPRDRKGALWNVWAGRLHVVFIGKRHAPAEFTRRCAWRAALGWMFHKGHS